MLCVRRPHWVPIAALVLASAFSGCTQFPELDAVQTPGLEDAPYPKLLPMDELLKGPEPRATIEQIGQVTGRVAGLRARAARLQAQSVGPVGIDQRIKRLRQKAAALREQ
ncbi:hypothetical protein [Thalassococcus lentus]|uniref:Uncharacterized protein n=1 Tax=Thalassococcus lentus TaxID=1210524 RepID=A0ABT4XQ89_9RHOB|nr:hypothetical protein [Thalassococcus lentus]MDA7424070.1 hypothetical protein [Thalassococcus lentus]